MPPRRRVPADVAADDPLLTEMLYGRGPRLKVFISSEMRSGRLREARAAVADTVEQTGAHVAWYWERDANAGPYCAEHICLGHAQASDCLILLLGHKLTEITRREYEEAKQAGAACFVLVQTGVRRSSDATEFLRREERTVCWKSFTNIPELRSAVTAALLEHTVRSVRQQQASHRARLNAPARWRSPSSRGGQRDG